MRGPLPPQPGAAHLCPMLTRYPNIVIASPPKRSARKQKAPADKLASIVMDKRPAPVPEADRKVRGDAADRERVPLIGNSK